MNTSVTIQEDRHQFWRWGTYISGILCLLLFLVYWNVANPFWESIFRFGSFIFFALVVLGVLKMMNGPLIVTLSRSKDKLMVSYQKKDRVVHEEEFEKSTIKEVSLQKIDQKSLTSYLQPESATMRINFSDSDRNLFLFEFGGRPLFFAPSSIQKVQNFLQENDVNLSSYSRTGSG